MVGLTVVIPMAGLGMRFAEYGFTVNKYMLPLNTRMEKMIELAILSLNVDIKRYDVTFVFVTRNIDSDISLTLKNVCKGLGCEYHIVDLLEVTDGPATSVMKARQFIKDDHALIISNSDQVLIWDFGRFMDTCEKYDGCVLTYKPDYIDTLEIGASDKHSFAKLDKNGVVVDFSEKVVLSDTALVGVHYFAKASDFFEAYDLMVSMNLRAPNGEFYISAAYKAMLTKGKRVGIHHIGGVEEGVEEGVDGVEGCVEKFLPTGEPGDYFDYLHKYGGYKFEVVRIKDEYSILGGRIVYKIFGGVGGDIGGGVGEGRCICILSGENEGKIICGNGSGIVKYINEGDKIVIINGLSCFSSSEEEVYNIKDFVRGWFIGAFEPSVSDAGREFEVGFLEHKRGEKWDFHYHKGSDEYNILVSGKMLLNGVAIGEGSVFVIYKNQIACPVFLEDCKVLCVKVPFVKNDKFCL